MQCQNCNTSLTKYQKKFCSNSCAAHFNNKNRVRSEESKQKTSTSLVNFYQKHPELSQQHAKRLAVYSCSRVKHEMPLTKEALCTVCNKPFIAKRTSVVYYERVCSDQCMLQRKRHNAKGIKRVIYKGITFDSHWEADLAEWLDSKSISWCVPKNAIPWKDLNGHPHRYYPDFYLPDYNVYLDPKNVIVIQLQKEKLDIVSKLIPLIYGHIDRIKELVVQLPRVERGSIGS